MLSSVLDGGTGSGHIAGSRWGGGRWGHVDEYPRRACAVALLTGPRLLIADEPTTALDVTVQAEILDLLREANRRDGTAMLFISHDIGVIAALCHRVLVMYAGRIVEELPVADLAAGRARHPYTRALLDATPRVEAAGDGALATIPGRPPAPADRPAGCAFASRCALAMPKCAEEPPAPVRVGADHRAACHAVEQRKVEENAP